jgi:hypothetical protein
VVERRLKIVKMHYILIARIVFICMKIFACFVQQSRLCIPARAQASTQSIKCAGLVVHAGLTIISIFGGGVMIVTLRL